jgi:hypothetical protein
MVGNDAELLGERFSRGSGPPVLDISKEVIQIVFFVSQNNDLLETSATNEIKNHSSTG